MDDAEAYITLLRYIARSGSAGRKANASFVEACQEMVKIRAIRSIRHALERIRETEKQAEAAERLRKAAQTLLDQLPEAENIPIIRTLAKDPNNPACVEIVRRLVDEH